MTTLFFYSWLRLNRYGGQVMKQFAIRMFGESIKERMNELGMTKTALIEKLKFQWIH